MKKFFTLPAALLILFSVYGQQRCAHVNSFSKSLLSDTLDAISYTIRMDNFDFSDQEFTSQTDVLLMSKVDDLDHITLELQDLTVDSVFVDDSEVTGFSHSGYFLYIPLDNPVNSGEMITATVYYHGHPFHESWGGFHWSGEYCFNLGVGFESIPHNLGKTWFPCIDDFQDRATYELYVTVEVGKDAVCGGTLESITNNGDGTRTYHWSLQQSIPTYLASVAVGDYAKWTGTYSGMEGDIPIEIWAKPIDSADVDATFANLNQIMGIFEESFGPYRWDRIGYVGTAIGAMEHACNIAFPFSGFSPGLGNESWYTHELVHMWFGDNVTCSSAEEMWLNEGWAVFAEALYREFLYGKESYLDFLNDIHADVIQYCHTSGQDGGYFPLNQIPQTVTYGMSAYDRGATVAHSLRGYLGDELFFDAMTEYNDYFQHNFASSYDLRDIITQQTGVDMSDWFDNWVFNSGTPHYSVDSFTVAPNAAMYDVTVYMKQKRHGPAFTGNSNRMELTFMDNAWNQHDETMQFDGETGMQTFTVPFSPDIIIPDFNEKQCDAITDAKSVIKETGQYTFPGTYLGLEVVSVPEDSAFVYIGHQWAPPDSLKTPIQGLTISNYRYWIVDGIFPEGFNATGNFWYNVNAYLDDGILTPETDSILLLYRPSAAYDWQYIDYTVIGIWNIGKFFVENLQRGEYTIAAADDTFVGLKEHKHKKKAGIDIRPNPGNGEFRIEVTQPGTLLFYDVSGNLADSQIIHQDSGTAVWDARGMAEGTYFVRFIPKSGSAEGVSKIVVMKN